MNQLNSISRNREKHSFRFLIFIISLIYGYVMNLGIYGFGKDFYANYSNANMFVGGYEDRIGWIIATATIGDFHIGVFLTSFLISFSVLNMIVHFTELTLKKRLHVTIFLIITLIILHSWPILMSTSNAMRQGIMMSFIYLSLVALDRKENLKALFYVILMLLSHKSGLLFLSMLISAVVYDRFISKQLNSLFYSIIIITIFAVLINYLPNASGRIIGADFSIAFFIIGLLTLFNLKPRSDGKRSVTSAYVYVFLLFSPVLFFGVANFQYERIWMVNIILVMLVIMSRVKRNQATPLAIFEFSLLMALTFATGMFSSGLT